MSKALSGILLPHEKFGTHLDSSRKIINLNLEKRNFKAAGEILAKVWEDGCDLEVLGNKVIDEEDISQEGEENSEILVADGDDDHAPLINIYELLMNSEFIKIQTDRDD